MYELIHRDEASRKKEECVNDRPRLFVDMDGTLARFHDEAKYLERMYEPGFFVSLGPFENTVKTVREVKRIHPDWGIYILSAVIYGASPDCETQKQQWLDRHLPEIDGEHRLFPKIGADKSAFIPGGIRKNDVLIDDYNKNLEEWRSAGGVAIKFVNNINDKGLYGPRWDGERLHYLSSAALNAERLDRIVSPQARRVSAPDETQPTRKRPRSR